MARLPAMRTHAIIAGILALTVAAIAAVPSDIAHLPKADIAATIRHTRQLAADAIAEKMKLTAELAAEKQATVEAESETEVVQQKLDRLNAAVAKEKARGDKFEGGYNKITWPLAGAVALFVFSSLMHVTNLPLLGTWFAQYRIYIAGALALAALFAVHALIGRWAFS